MTGLVEALSVVPRSFAMIGQLTELARRERPDVAVVIDFPDFHLGFGGLGLAPRLKALGIPVIYYIPPQLWAWRRTRLALIKRVADRVLVIFPFEEQLYQDAGIPVEFVGHPLDRPRAAAGAPGRVSSRDRSRPVAPRRGAAAGQPPERSRAAASRDARRRTGNFDEAFPASSS